MLGNFYAKDIMKTDLQVVYPDDEIKTVIEKLAEYKISGLPVIDENENLVGVISEKDVINVLLSGNVNNTKVKEIMTKKVVSCDLMAPLEQVSMIIAHNNFRRVPITDKGKLVGLISRSDIIDFFYNHFYKNE